MWEQEICICNIEKELLLCEQTGIRMGCREGAFYMTEIIFPIVEKLTKQEKTYQKQLRFVGKPSIIYSAENLI